MNRIEYARELHANGVHTHCTAPHGRERWVANGQRGRGDLTSRNCHLHGRVERFHSHDHDGPLACGCEEEF